jgi:hypothetical protein
MAGAGFARSGQEREKALTAEEEVALAAERQIQAARDLEHLILYERDPAQSLTPAERLRLAVREPARLAAADQHAEALGRAREVEQRSHQMEQADRNRTQARELVGVLRQAVTTCLVGLVGRLVVARQHSELEADMAEPLAQALARVLAQAVATCTNVPELAQAARAIGTVVRSAAFERIEPDLSRMLERLEQHLTTRPAGLGEPAFSSAIDAAALARTLCETALQVVAKAQRGTQHAGLPAALCAQMERSLGEDLGSVKVHRESTAAGSAQAVTVGDEIHLGPGQDLSESTAGKRVLGHELAHVVQQQGRGAALPGRLGEEDRRELLELEADGVAEAIAAGERAEVRFAAPRGMRQGYEAFEHRIIGRAAGGGRKLVLDSGLAIGFEEVVWLAGDLYGSFAALKKAPREEVERLLGISARQEGYARRRGGRPSKKEQSEIDEALQAATAWRERTHYEGHQAQGTEGAARGGEEMSFETLARDNYEHFARANLARWEGEHTKAMEAAERALTEPANRSQHLNEALLHEAVGAHFLSDAFAAGHLVDGALGRQWAEDLIAAEYSQILKAIVLAARADGGYIDEAARQNGWAPGADSSYAVAFALSVGIAHGGKGVLASLLLKVVHDHFNAEGVLVRNQVGDEWRTPGDSHLHLAARARELAIEAVRAGREEVEARACGDLWVGRTPDMLVPSQVFAGGRWEPLEEFRQSRELFLGILRPRIFDPTTNNKLYQMVRANMLSVMKNQGRELFIGAGHAVGHGTVRALERMGENEKRNAEASFAAGQALKDGAVRAGKLAAEGVTSFGRAMIGADVKSPTEPPDTGLSGVDVSDGGVP